MYSEIGPEQSGTHPVIDLRSDTLTKPSPAMREAMAKAEVGDDVYAEDPTVRMLEERVAAMAGKEAGLFVPSGTQSNLIALMTHCNRGDEFIVGTDYHSFLYETGGAAAVGSIIPNPIPTDEHGGLSPEQIKAAIKPDNISFAQTKLLALENTVSGQVQSANLLSELCQTAQSCGLITHLDGARVWNAMIATGETLEEIATPFDSLSTCLSKGLGAPVGSVLCGSKEFIRKAARNRKMLGGGMRQAGVLAACGLYALDHNLAALQQDHLNAGRLASGLTGIDNLIAHAGDTNMMFLEPLEKDRDELIRHLKDHRIFVGGSAKKIRVVTHLDISEQDIERTIDAVNAFYGR